MSSNESLSSIQSLFPNWIEYTASQYSSDLNKLNIRWVQSCVAYRVKPQCVLVVSNIKSEGKEAEDIEYALQTLSKSGYSIIESHAVQKCEGCGKLIVSSSLLEKNGISTKVKCGDCERK